MNKWMKIAYNEALEGMQINDGGPFGAVIVKNSQIIASTHNKVLKTNDPTAHAEINAIREASKKLARFDLSDCTLYTTCQPCPMCLGAIFWARIGRVYYGATKDDASFGGFDDSYFYDMISQNTKDVIFKQIDHKINAELFIKWKNKKDAKLY